MSVLPTQTTIVGSYLELCGLLLALLVLEASSESILHKVYLNSYGHCGHDKTFQVLPGRGYVLKADVSPNTGTNTFRDCETNFYSARENGRLCIVQDGEMVKIDDKNAELLVHDGYDTEDTPLIFSLRFQHGWPKREHCTNSPHLNLYLRKINKTERVDIRKVTIDLKVLDIESRDRKVYLNELYCNQTYPLLNSQVTVYNREQQNIDLQVVNVTQTCSIKFEKEKKDNKSVCFVYVPSDHISSRSNWSIKIFSASENIVYTLQYRDNKASEWHAWCGSNSTYSITLQFQREDSINVDSMVEAPKMFKLVFADFQGSSEIFLDKIKSELMTSKGNSGLELGWIFCIVVVLVLLITLVIIVYWKRHALPCLKYKAILNPGNTASL